MNMWRVLGGLFTAIVLLIGGGLLWLWVGPPADAKSDIQRETFEKPLNRLVLRDFERADIQITAGTDKTIRIQRELKWTRDKPSFTETWSGDTLQVTADVDCDSWLGDMTCDAKYLITVPENIVIEAESSSGDVRLTGAVREAQLYTASGDIDVRNTTGKLEMRTTSGDIATSGVSSATITAVTTSGDIQLRFADQPSVVAATAVSGDVSIDVPRGQFRYRVSVETASGDQGVHIDNDPASDKSITAKTVSGDVSVTG